MSTEALYGGGIGGDTKTTFFNHVFSTTDESKAEFLNVFQYSMCAILPVILLNKTISRLIPDIDPDKSTLEIIFEIVFQIVILLFGIIIIHRAITYVPTYSGFKYHAFNLTNVILVFFVIVFSIQSKISFKLNILVERVMVLWNGEERPVTKKDVSSSRGTIMSPLLPQPQPQAQAQAQASSPQEYDSGPVPANFVLGGSFSNLFS
jgi:hypothetical protein